MPIDEDKDGEVMEIEIQLEASSDIDRLLAELQTLPSTIRKATVSVSQTSLEDERILLYLAKLPWLQHLALSSRLGTKLRISVGFLASFFQEAKRLESFSIQSATLTAASHEEFEELGSSLRDHPSLKEFKLIPCQLEEQWRETNSLDPLLNSLSTIRTLESVYITCPRGYGLGKISGESIGAICASQIARLTLPKFPIHQEALRECCSAMATNTTLKEITLGRCAMSNKLDESISRMLLSNSCLRSISLVIANGNIPSQLIQTAQALQSSRSVQDLTIWGTTTKETQEAFLKSVQANCILERVWLDGNQLQRDFHFYQALNSLLRPLYENEATTKKDWIEAIAKKQNSLGAIFHLLSRNPSLCQASSLM